ncbi:MAG: FliM/FliN family flagellar motor switch protein [Phycisphaerae bacterium]|nr:FliM/FliN family flagellar motor switch protein [Phycisphaerae bacterium]
MASELAAVLKLEVPVIVLLGERRLPLGEVTSFIPGAIIELPKNADSELELRVNNKPVGTGRAVKVGENFGLRISFIGDVRTRIEAMGPPLPSSGPIAGVGPGAEMAEKIGAA